MVIRISNMLKRINDSLPGLIVGILIYGVLVEVIGVWIVEDKLGYTVGLAIGVAIACGLAINIAIVIRDAIEIYGEERAKQKIIGKSLLRYAVVVVVFFAMLKWEIGNPIIAFVGVMGLKVSAYLQPLAHRFLSTLRGRGDVSSYSEDSESS